MPCNSDCSDHFYPSPDNFFMNISTTSIFPPSKNINPTQNPNRGIGQVLSPISYTSDPSQTCIFQAKPHSSPLAQISHAPSWKSGKVNKQEAAQSSCPIPCPESGQQFPLHAFTKPVKSNKRTLEEFDSDERSRRKKLRTRPQPHYKLDLSILDGLTPPLLPPSPLFFSHSPRRRPPLPLRYSSSEAGIAMLTNTDHEDRVGITTVKMARGTLNRGSSPARSVGTPYGRGSAERSSISSADEKDTAIGLQILSQVGISEILEIDDRPSFIIDLGNTANFQPGPLNILFSNSALRAHGNLVDVITGYLTQKSPALNSSYPEFKYWCTSFVKNHQSMDVFIPSFTFCGFAWTCSTLRKRLRLIRGSSRFDSASASSNPPSIGGTRALSFASSKLDGSSRASMQQPYQKLQEPSDYFGDGQVAATLDQQDDDFPDGMLPSTESPDPSMKVLDSGTPLREAHQNIDPKSSSGSPLVKSGLLSPLGIQPYDTVSGVIPTDHMDAYNTSTHSDQECFDWTRLPVTAAMPPHVQFARSVDWSATSIGSIDTWPGALRGMCNLIMASPHPAAMYWGDDFIAIYNEAYILLAGQKHPQLMGMSYKVAWVEIWDALEDVFEQAKLTGQATMKDDDQLFIWRAGFLEETYFSWSIIPLVGDDGSVVGLYNPCFEKTRRVIAERRLKTLREVGEKIADARDVKSFWGQALKGLEYNEFDTPFVLLYSVSDDCFDSDGSSIHSNSILAAKQCILEGTLGVPEGHKSALTSIDLKASSDGFGQVFKEAMLMDQPVLLEVATGTLDAGLLEGINWRGFGDPCTAAVVCPIHPTTGDSILGFLVMGINPRRPYDDDYSLFVQLLARQLATATASVVLFEEEIKRGQRAARLAAADLSEISEQLAARTQEAVESETKFTRMAEFAPVGMFIANSEGRITYCNDNWYEITRHPKEENSTDNWMDSVKDEDMEKVAKLWSSLVVDKIPMNAEFRFKTPWTDRNNNIGDTWVLASAYPERSEDGSLKSVFGSITNISQQKWAEDFQKRRREEAVELKRQQENFIDITSHEMRNPLSAILQCADEISMSLSDFRSENPSNKKISALFESNIDAAQTIALCANHQKRIVDDVLTLSKLDSALLLVTPVDVQPVHVVQRALKMFEAEMQNADIKMEFRVDDSFNKLHVDWVRIDPSRLLQVLINLTTNAIKFTTTQAQRTIKITLSALLEPPSNRDTNLVKYFPTRSKRKDLTETADWGTGEQVYIHFAVRDTGRGLSESEMKLLFLRFSQASPRTHVQYGGSGLGLFISRELVELQGGEIGVSSESGVGSTFAFYVKARRSTTPEEAIESLHSAGGARKAPGMKLSKVSSSNVVPKLNGILVKPPISNHDLKVLIVEDNLVNQRVLQKQLRNIGCVVYVANHGGECIDRLKESTFWAGHAETAVEISVILMDQEMPVMDGLTCTRKIRELQKAGEVIRHIPIIAVTANARSEQIDTALSTGMDDVVSKPFRIPELIPKIKELVGRYPN